jgi:hypothetical protein
MPAADPKIIAKTSKYSRLTGTLSVQAVYFAILARVQAKKKKIGGKRSRATIVVFV